MLSQTVPSKHTASLVIHLKRLATQVCARRNPPQHVVGHEGIADVI
ncbi:hypothetical protein SMCF_8735, partial [Streptomyces coelicoflavus ZG0656]